MPKPLGTSGIRLRGQFLAFWGNVWPSRWFEAPFTVDGLTFPTLEHYRVWYKSSYFEDYDRANSVLSGVSAKDAFRLGRELKADEDEWSTIEYPVMVVGTKFKFLAQPELRRKLIETLPYTLVEASPHDPVWGVKRGTKDAEIRNPGLWKGKNLGGLCLMEVRASFITDVTHVEDGKCSIQTTTLA